jgi:predicted DCC family thiol-disulfide oxidoreductase YuxK
MRIIRRPPPFCLRPEDPVVLFDGVCNFCNGSVNFLLDHDRDRRLRFCAMQSDAGQAILAWAGLPRENFNSLVLVEHGRVYQKTDAVLRIAWHLPLPWRLAGWALLIPPFVRDWFYDRLALNRYALFGRTESCRMPTPEIAGRFLLLQRDQGLVPRDWGSGIGDQGKKGKNRTRGSVVRGSSFIPDS